MSLINDAIKRANQSAPPPQNVGQPMQPADSGAVPKLPLILIPVLLVTVLGMAVWFLVKGLEVARQAYRPSSQETVAARERQSSNLPPASAPNATAKPAPEPEIVAKPADPAPKAPAPALPTPPVDPLDQLKVQAVFYRPANPSAVINSKMVGIGSKIGDVTVLSISKETVVVERGGAIREITVP